MVIPMLTKRRTYSLRRVCERWKDNIVVCYVPPDLLYCWSIKYYDDEEGEGKGRGWGRGAIRTLALRRPHEREKQYCGLSRNSWFCKAVGQQLL